MPYGFAPPEGFQNPEQMPLQNTPEFQTQLRLQMLQQRGALNLPIYQRQWRSQQQWGMHQGDVFAHANQPYAFTPQGQMMWQHPWGFPLAVPQNDPRVPSSVRHMPYLPWGAQAHGYDAPNFPQQRYGGYESTRPGGGYSGGRAGGFERERGGYRSERGSQFSRRPQETEEQRQHADEVRARIEGITINGQPLRTERMQGNFLRRKDIPPATVEQHIASLTSAAKRIEGAINVRRETWGKLRWDFACDGVRVWGLSGSVHLLATATQVLASAPGADRTKGGAFQSLEGDRVQVRFDALSNGVVADEFNVEGPQGAYKIHERRDGRVVRMRGGHTSLYVDRAEHQPTLIHSSRSGRVPLALRPDGRSVDVRQGVSFISEGGRPMGKFQQEVSRLREQNPGMGDLALTRIYMQEAARELRTPEAIGTWINIVHKFVPEPRRQQDIKSPERMLLEGGDCEDIAGLALAMLRLIGINGVVLRKGSYHYVCAYIEQSPSGFNYCTIDTNGFNRDRRTYRSAGEAIAAVWPDAARWEARQRNNDPRIADMAAHAVNQGGGASIYTPSAYELGANPNPDAHTQIVPFANNEIWQQYVVRRG
ncbi:MAG: hypothetical protein Q7R81_05425 [Candidatus Peregrinibacteria bacterium]|nr:hypothetical protein [Candidatus Peregrinibacteria bacterium]